MSPRFLAAAAFAALLLEGCAQPQPPTVVAQDLLNEGIAKTCTFSPVQPKPGATVEATVTMTNDGWCAFRASESSGKAYQLGLVKQRPAHGELNIRKWNGETRVEYNPNPSYVGADRFLVALRPDDGGADALVQVAVTVSRGEGVPVTAPTPEPEHPAATTRRSTTRRRTTTTH